MALSTCTVFVVYLTNKLVLILYTLTRCPSIQLPNKIRQKCIECRKNLDTAISPKDLTIASRREKSLALLTNVLNRP